ncbi:hypothetical protein COU12_01085 [Candidatus Jorgensenbacteria bacterium CG10_big_fil_rev_8_21_14_0_10_54_38]|uniref:3D domain-containing protein n=1 Tax=Candidatus Jorgensenbacteria bacterium CG10_big_fil_rev_8_21_14_0_10_54_38 TaxID=1974593 RepID=A0A2M6WGB1_9BACT|nr:MAG: hypothetical protein COU12_01085 [Candidatus Jorgensenbacteria bacterium CG10_big_fil_rev_8_21_14_0_10_54_38]
MRTTLLEVDVKTTLNAVKRALRSYPRKFLTGHTYAIASLIGLAMLISPSVGSYTASRAPQVVPEETIQIAEAKEKAAGPEIYEVWVTAYASTPEETDGTPFTTAMNTETHDGVIAVNFLPFRTRVRIPALFGDKVFTVEDRMHRRKMDFVDIWMPSKAEAVGFGIVHAAIEVVDQGVTISPSPAN